MDATGLESCLLVGFRVSAVALLPQGRYFARHEEYNQVIRLHTTVATASVVTNITTTLLLPPLQGVVCCGQMVMENIILQI